MACSKKYFNEDLKLINEFCSVSRYFLKQTFSSSVLGCPTVEIGFKRFFNKFFRAANTGVLSKWKQTQSE